MLPLLLNDKTRQHAQCAKFLKVHYDENETWSYQVRETFLKVW